MIDENLVDLVWAEHGKAPRTANKVIVHPEKYTGENVPAKVKRMRSTMR